jgi:methyl-accepting chemotaxis protein
MPPSRRKGLRGRCERSQVAGHADGQGNRGLAAQIAAIQDATASSLEAIAAIDATITCMNEFSNNIAASMEKQRASTREIAQNAQKAARGTHAVSKSIRSVNDAPAETGTAATEVLASSEDSTSRPGWLRTEVDQFLANIRVA